MFEVRTTSPFGDGWEALDTAIAEAAGKRCDFRGVNLETGVRDHSWLVEEFADAVAMKDRLNGVEGVTATIREVNSVR